MSYQTNSTEKGRSRPGLLPAAVLAVAVTLSFGARALLAVEPDGPPPEMKTMPLPGEMGFPDTYPPEGGTRVEDPGDADYDRDNPEAYDDERGRSGSGDPRGYDDERGRSEPDDTGYGREWQPSPSMDEDPGMGPGWPTERPSRRWRDPVRRRPAPIPPGRALPFYPPEPPPSAPPSSAVLAPPDFIGSAAGSLEIPVGQTGTLFVRGYREAKMREERVARVVARETDRVLVRGRFPGRTLLEVEVEGRRDIYIVRVR